VRKTTSSFLMMAITAPFFGLLSPVFAASAPAPVSPASAPSEFSLFEEIATVTSASRIEEPLLEAPAAVSVISSKQLDRWGKFNLPDVFRNVPGMDVKALTETSFGVSTRGFNERLVRRMLVLQDGMSVYMPIDSGTPWTDLPLVMEDIDNIEVVRGVNDTLYGFNAFNGVVNIKTKDPKDTHGFMTKFLTGSDSHNRYTARYGDKMVLDGKDLDYRLTYTYEQSAGYSADVEPNVQDWRQLNNLTTRSKYIISDKLNLELLTGFKGGSQGRVDQVSFTGVTADVATFFNFQEVLLNAEISETNNAVLKFYRWYYSYNPKIVTEDSETRDTKEMQYDLEATDEFSLMDGRSHTVWGGSWRFSESQSLLVKKEIPANDVQPLRDILFSFFANEKYTLIQDQPYIHKLIGTIGVRGESSRFIDNLEWAPKIALIYEPVEHHALRASFGRGYRLPTFREEYFTFFSPVVTGSVIQFLGNRDLKRESVDSYEIGYSTELMEGRLVLDADAYIANYEGIQTLAVTQTGLPSITSYNNSQAARSFGVELAGSYAVDDALNVYSNYTYQEIHDKRILGSAHPFRGSVPQHKINGGFHYKFLDENVRAMPLLKDVSFDVSANYTSRWVDYIGGVATGVNIKHNLRTDIRVAKEFFKKDLEVAFNIENLTGREHYESRFERIPQIFYTTVTFRDWPWNLGKDRS